MNKCLVWNLGLTDYKTAYDMQLRLADSRYQKKTGDIILTLEHPPTITLGKFGNPDNILAGEEELSRLGIEVCASNRGGDVSFHCPGQLVIYPILDMRLRGGELRRFMHDLEQAVIDTAQHFGIRGERWPEHPGVWVEGKQLAAIGLHFMRGISMHGISFNINPSLDGFKTINLCGLPGKEATSISALAKREVNADEARPVFLNIFSQVLGVEFEVVENPNAQGGILG